MGRGGFSLPFFYILRPLINTLNNSDAKKIDLTPGPYGANFEVY
jgi:hypothetical protein